MPKIFKDEIRFFYNGIKVGRGPLQRARYSFTEGWTRHGTTIPTNITIYARDICPGFSAEVRAAFAVENGSDGQTDYYETDRIRVKPCHPRFIEVAAMLHKAIEKDYARAEHKGRTEDARSYRQELAQLLAHLSATVSNAA